MGQLPEFYVDQDLCTECGDCIKAVPQAFRKVEDEEVAEVYNVGARRHAHAKSSANHDGLSWQGDSLEEEVGSR